MIVLQIWKLNFIWIKIDFQWYSVEKMEISQGCQLRVFIRFPLLNDRLYEPHRDVWGSSGGFTGMYGGVVVGVSENTNEECCIGNESA